MEPLKDDEIDEAQRLCAAVTGFDRTHFEFRPAHSEDRGIGRIADVVHIDDQLVAVTEDVDDPYVIADGIERHVAEGIAEHIDAAKRLAKLLPRALVDLKAARQAIEILRVDQDAYRDMLTRASAMLRDADEAEARAARMYAGGVCPVGAADLAEEIEDNLTARKP